MTGPEGDVEGAVEGGLDESGLEPAPGTLDLADPSDRWTVSDWESATAAVLRKSRRMTPEDPDSLVWERLTRRTLDGIEVLPLGTADLLRRLETTGRPTRAGDWDIRSRVEAGSEKQMQEVAVVDLEGGVTSLWLASGPDTDFGTLLEGVLLDLAGVVLDPTADPLATAEAFLAHAGDGDLAPGTNLGCDALAPAEELVAVARLARERGVLGVVVDGTAAHDRGASDVTEIGYLAAAAARALRVLDQAGIPPREAAALIELRVAVSDEQFGSIAKLRAVRRVWARLLELSGASPGASGQVSGARIHAVTSRPMMTRYDPWVNMLRATVAAFAAGVGGAESVTVLPFDAALGRPDAFGRRIARNTSHLLIDEAHVAHVADPAGGAYAVEKLTDDMAVAGWAALGRLDGADGPDRQELEAMVEAAVTERAHQVATRRRPITGVSEFPNLAEQLPVREPYDGWEGVAGYAAAYEAMRDDPPADHVFLATLGSIAQHTARATFASNLLAAGGVAVDVAGPTAGPDELVAAYQGQRVVCLAGADATYEEWGEAAVAALREAGAERVIVAGKATDHTDDSCAMGVDALAFLTRTREALQ